MGFAERKDQAATGAQLIMQPPEGVTGIGRMFDNMCAKKDVIAFGQIFAQSRGKTKDFSLVVRQIIPRDGQHFVTIIGQCDLGRLIAGLKERACECAGSGADIRDFSGGEIVRPVSPFFMHQAAIGPGKPQAINAGLPFLSNPSVEVLKGGAL